MKIGAEQGLEILARVEQLAAQRLYVVVLLLFVEKHVIDPAVALAVTERRLARPTVRDRSGNQAGQIGARVVAQAQANFAFHRFRAGARGHDVDGAAYGVLAVERSLRSAQHLHALQVEHFRVDVGNAAQVHVIHEHRH